MKTLVSRFNLKYDYYITEDGEIYSPISNRWLKSRADKDGYQRITLMNEDGVRKAIPIHRAVLMTFAPCDNMSELQVNHIDGNKLNNSLENLEWVTTQENIQHSKENALHAFGERNAGAIINEETAKEIISLILSKQYTLPEIAEKTNTSLFIVERIKYKKTWTHLTKDCDFTDTNKPKKLTEPEVLEIIQLLLQKEKKQIEIAQLFNVHKGTINAIKKKKNWKHLTNEINFD